MAKTSTSIDQDSTTKSVESQDNFLVKAEVYSSLRKLTKFDAIIFKKMANNTYPAARKSLSDWDSFRNEYQNSGKK